MLVYRNRLCVTVIRNFMLLWIFIVLIFIYQIKSMQKKEISIIISKTGMENIFLENNNLTTKLNKSEIEGIILTHNRDERILNEEVYGPISRDTVIMVIFIDKSSVGLKFMLFSLSQVKGIHEVLLIFSHSYYDENVNALLKRIEFCRVLQIYYPHSLQLYPNKFPGFEVDDCPDYFNIKAAESMNCTGANFWDIHGHYRNPQIAEKKHHWWWTANQVFENLTCTGNHDGTVVFIKDNFYFIEDFLYMTLYMKNIASSLDRCEMFSLATSSSTFPSGDVQHAVEVASWDPLLHSDILAFDLSVWNSIVSHYQLFCGIDDSSWAQSLLYLSLNRRDGGRYRVMSSVFPRAYKQFTCLYFGSFLDCDAFTSVYHIMKLQNETKENLFPPNLEVFVDIELDDEYLSFDYVGSNGGWNDPRDRDFCKNMTVNKIKKQILDMNNQFEDFTVVET